MAHVIIPTKSNVAGITTLVPQLMTYQGVTQLTVVADGPEAFAHVSSLYPNLDLLQVPLGAGIHAMWNKAMEYTDEGQHVLFLNDDVTIDSETISSLEEALTLYTDLGLVCPTYAPFPVPYPYREVDGTCGGRYDGTGGLGGFCMMLRADLAEEWRFDERMKWWCGDDDVLNWVRITKGQKAAIVSTSRCWNNTSWTINNDPPADFNATVAEDIRIYQSKTY